MDVPAPPPLRRSFATVHDDQEKEFWAVRWQATRAYGRLKTQFHGPPLLVGDTVIIADAWEAQLDLALDAAEREGKLKEFSLETWLGARIQTEGTDEDRTNWKILMEQMESYETPVEPLPIDIYSQPLIEVETFRGLDDLLVEDDDDFSSVFPGMGPTRVADDDDDDVTEHGDIEN